MPHCNQFAHLNFKKKENEKKKSQTNIIFFLRMRKFKYNPSTACLQMQPAKSCNIPGV